MNSTTKHALEIVGFVVIVALILEMQLAVRRQVVSDEPPAPRESGWPYRGQWQRISYTGTYGRWIVGVRVAEIAIVFVALVVALIAQLV
jgi:hypothetical protein